MSAPRTPPPKPALTNFVSAFGRESVWAASAPGRVNLIGEHLDYNGGFVLPAAINRAVTVVAAPLPGREIRIRTSYYPDELVIDLQSPPVPDRESQPKWSRYLTGVASAYLQLGAEIPGLAVWVESTVPLGSGLSSSAALEVAFATLLEDAAAFPLSPEKKALLCQRAEHDFAGVPCGIMDQFASALGRKDHFLHIDCLSQEITAVPFEDPAVTLLIGNTNVSHSLASGAYARRREECETALERLAASSWRAVALADLEKARATGTLDTVLFQRARHVVTEIDRTRQAVNKIREADWATLGELMFASHVSLATDFAVSCPELDAVVSSAREIGPDGGLYGARMTGGGFGGSTIALVRSAHAEEIMARLARAYADRTRFTLDCFVTRPASGARAHACLAQA